MPSFNLAKGGKFAIDKGIRNIVFGLGWDVAPNRPVDVDAHLLAVVPRANGDPVFFNDASHALTYANKAPNGALKVNANGSFETQDGSLHHSGDDRTGGVSKDDADESLTAYLDKLPEAITELQLWVTIHEPAGATFSAVSNAFAKLVNKDTGVELAKYLLTTEFATARAVQIGSLTKANGIWTFGAIGAGMDGVGLGDILQKLS